MKSKGIELQRRKPRGIVREKRSELEERNLSRSEEARFLKRDKNDPLAP